MAILICDGVGGAGCNARVGKVRFDPISGPGGDA